MIASGKQAPAVLPFVVPTDHLHSWDKGDDKHDYEEQRGAQEEIEEEVDGDGAAKIMEIRGLHGWGGDMRAWMFGRGAGSVWLGGVCWRQVVVMGE